jgi:hypothetical protein
MTVALRRAAVRLADGLLFVYVASWLVIGGLALAGPLTPSINAVVSFGTAAVAFLLAVVLRIKAGDAAAVQALARLVLLFGGGIISNMGPPWYLLEAAGAVPLFLAAGSLVGGALDPVLSVLYLWLPVRPHWVKFAAVLHFTAVYPHPLLFASRLRQALAEPALLWGAAIAVSVSWALVEMWAPAPAERAAYWISMALLPAAGLLTLANVRTAYRSATAEEQGRIAGLLAAVVIALAAELLYHLWPVPLLGHPPAIAGALHIAAPAAASLLAVYAVFVRGGLSPELVLRRTSLYGMLSIGGVFLFSLVDQLLSALLAARLGLPDGFASAVALAAVAVAFKPVHDRLARRLNRLLAPPVPPVSAGVVDAAPAIAADAGPPSAQLS